MTTGEPTLETTDVSNGSGVEYPSGERSDSSIQATVSENLVGMQNTTTPRSLSLHTDLLATNVSESKAPSEGVHVTTRRTIEDTARTMNTTDASTASGHALLTTRTISANETGSAEKPSSYRQPEDMVSTVSEVTSKAPSGSMSSQVETDSPKGQLIGLIAGVTVGVIVLIVIIIIIVVVIYLRKQRKSCYITDHDLKDYRSLMKRPYEPPALASPLAAQPISPFSDMFPQDVASNGPPLSKYRMVNFDRYSDDGLDGVEIVHDDSREQRSPKEIPVQEYALTPSGYSDCSYSVNTFRPTEGKSKEKSADLAKSEAETILGADEAKAKCGNDEKAIEE